MGGFDAPLDEAVFFLIAAKKIRHEKGPCFRRSRHLFENRFREVALGSDAGLLYRVAERTMIPFVPLFLLGWFRV
jgi:hypothetical protein